jgi:hypothetical protein
MLIFRLLAALFGLGALVANAQFGPPPPQSPRVGSAPILGLDAERAAKVEAILHEVHTRMDAAREQIGPPTDDTTRATLHAAMEAIRTDAESKLLGVLNAEEMARLRTTLPLPRARMEAMRFRKG